MILKFKFLLVLLMLGFGGMSQILTMKQNDTLIDVQKEGIIYLDLKNLSNDTIYFSSYLYESHFHFINPRKVCAYDLSPRRNYPSKHSPPFKNDTTYCNELMFQKNVTIIPPLQTYTIEAHFGSSLCKGIKIGKKYNGTFTLIIYKMISDYCPKLWTGELESKWEWK